jgi:hypothetical protein
MSQQLELLLSGLILPLGLSLLWFAVSRRFAWWAWSLPLAWLPPYAWIIGGALPWFPQEASHWLWLLVLASLALSLATVWVNRSAGLWIAQAVLLAVAVVVLAWPVLKYEWSVGLGLELLLLVVVGSGLLFSASLARAATPALSLALSGGALALVTALGGSVLVGQLAGAMAAVLGVFALFGLWRGAQGDELSMPQLLPMLLLYLALLLIARLYAGIPLPSAVLLLLAPLPGWLFAGRLPALASAALGGTALVWLLITADASSYY